MPVDVDGDPTRIHLHSSGRLWATGGFGSRRRLCGRGWRRAVETAAARPEVRLRGLLVAIVSLPGARFHPRLRPRRRTAASAGAEEVVQLGEGRGAGEAVERAGGEARGGTHEAAPRRPRQRRT